MTRVIGETVMVYNPENGDMYEMNDTAAMLIGYLQEEYSGEEILNKICREYDVSESIVEEDLEPLLDRLLEIGLLKICEE